MKAPRQTAAHGIDTCGKVGFAKLYDRKTALTAADLLNDERFNRTVLNEF